MNDHCSEAAAPAAAAPAFVFVAKASIISVTSLGPTNSAALVLPILPSLQDERCILGRLFRFCRNQNRLHNCSFGPVPGYSCSMSALSVSMRSDS